MSRVTQKCIADRLGLSTQTVSMALRNHRRVAVETRKRVRETAEALGYRCDPALQSLIAYRSSEQFRGPKWSHIAVLHDWSSPEAIHENYFANQYLEALFRLGDRRGLRIDSFWLGHQGEQATSTLRKLENRGITGVIVAPHSNDQTPRAAPLPAGRIQVVTTGPAHLYSGFISVQPDEYGNLLIAWDELWHRGYRRIGLIYEGSYGWRTDYAWLAGWYTRQDRMGRRGPAVEPRQIDGGIQSRRREARAWLRRCRPDAVIAPRIDYREIIGEVDPTVFVAEMGPLKSDETGVTTNFEDLCETQLDVLQAAMRESLTAESTVPTRVFVRGFWQDGLSATATDRDVGG